MADVKLWKYMSFPFVIVLLLSNTGSSSLINEDICKVCKANKQTTIKEYTQLIATPLLCKDTKEQVKCRRLQEITNDILLPHFNKQALDFCEKCEENNSDEINSTDYIEILTSKSVTVDAECELCKYFVTLIQKSVNKSAVFDEIKQFIYDGCMSTVNNTITCKLAATTAEGILRDLIQEGLSPANACLKSGFCKSGVRLDFSNTNKRCNVCMDAMDKLDDYLEKNYSNIREYLTKLCHSTIPPSVDKKILDKCLYLAVNLIPFLLSNILIPGVFCLNTGYCPDTSSNMLSDISF
ncbi:unnamed protein product [Owenia fusiformis]|uniref:Saposin B-type domain-containing protein n=1 Tax=Owenia fusiformis TaxID=6347 RepID=A0A8S4PM43_OWEFU|nr:unnamed protein product [Owenia fusiformis]